MRFRYRLDTWPFISCTAQKCFLCPLKSTSGQEEGEGKGQFTRSVMVQFRRILQRSAQQTPPPPPYILAKYGHKEFQFLGTTHWKTVPYFGSGDFYSIIQVRSNSEFPTSLIAGYNTRIRQQMRQKLPTPEK